MSDNSVKIQDLDLQIRVRSSKMPVTELVKITAMIAETLATSSKLGLVEQNTIVNKTLDKTLVTITTTFQSE